MQEPYSAQGSGPVGSERIYRIYCQPRPNQPQGKALRAPGGLIYDLKWVALREPCADLGVRQNDPMHSRPPDLFARSSSRLHRLVQNCMRSALGPTRLERAN